MRFCSKRGLEASRATASVWLVSLRRDWFESAWNMWAEGKSRRVKLRAWANLEGENRENMIFRGPVIWCSKEEQAEWRKAHLIRIGKPDLAKRDWETDWNHVWGWSS